MTEAELRRWHRGHSLTKTGLALSALSARAGLTYWSETEAADVDVSRFDRAGECEAAAMAVGRSLDLAVCLGWVATVDDGRERCYGHCWNLNSAGKIVDAARQRFNSSGYLGVVLTPADLDLLASRLPEGETPSGLSHGRIPPIGTEPSS